MGSKAAILKTLLYSDIFNYPLKKEEIHYFLISNKKTSIKVIDKNLKNIKEIDFKNGYYFLKGKERLVAIREKREKYSLVKLKKLKKLVKKLSLIWTIKFIGISGNLALKNTERKDDIDLFIISAKNTIWITRFLTIIMLKFLGVYRKRGEKKIRDKICTNMFIDESNLGFSKKRRNIYTAHELVQLKPLFNKKNIYQKFLLSNKWALNYLPNAFEDINFKEVLISKNNSTDKQNYFVRVVNHIIKIPQVIYMQKHKTSEEVSDKILAFHPFDYQDYVLRLYKEKLQNMAYNS